MVMKITSWNLGLTADLIDGGTYTKHFYSDYGGKKTTIDELIKWLENFKENVAIIEKTDEEE